MKLEQAGLHIGILLCQLPGHYTLLIRHEVLAQVARSVEGLALAQTVSASHSRAAPVTQSYQCIHSAQPFSCDLTKVTLATLFKGRSAYEIAQYLLSSSQ